MLATIVNATHPDTGRRIKTAMILEAREDGYIHDKFPDETIDGYLVDIISFANQLGVNYTDSAVYDGSTGLLATP